HGEREAMKALRDVFFRVWGLDRAQVSLSGYWAYGRTEDRFQAEKREPIGQIL
ncbi:SIP domain-containing protein, partial [Staphylococcus aureus]